MTIRESHIAASLAWVAMGWSAGFAVNTMLVAGMLTSPQWLSLMTVPGGKYFWVSTFGGAAVLLSFGLQYQNYKARAIGFGVLSLGCLGIATFYLIAPLFHAGPVTLGYWPWLAPAAIGVLGAITNWWPIEWF